MSECTLSKTQARALMTLVQQREQLRAAWDETAEAVNEQIEMLRQAHDLPEGTYAVRQEQDGALVMFAVPEEAGADE